MAVDSMFVHKSNRLESARYTHAVTPIFRKHKYRLSCHILGARHVSPNMRGVAKTMCHEQRNSFTSTHAMSLKRPEAVEVGGEDPQPRPAAARLRNGEEDGQRRIGDTSVGSPSPNKGSISISSLSVVAKVCVGGSSGGFAVRRQNDPNSGARRVALYTR